MSDNTRFEWLLSQRLERAYYNKSHTQHIFHFFN